MKRYIQNYLITIIFCLFIACPLYFFGTSPDYDKTNLTTTIHGSYVETVVHDGIQYHIAQCLSKNKNLSCQSTIGTFENIKNADAMTAKNCVIGKTIYVDENCEIYIIYDIMLAISYFLFFVAIIFTVVFAIELLA